MWAHIVDISEDTVQVTIGGSRKVRLQIYDWGEAGEIAGKVFTELDTVLGEGRTIQRSKQAGA